MPSIQVDDVGIAGLLGLDRRIDGRIHEWCIRVRFVGAVLHAVADVALGDMITERRRRAVGVRGAGVLDVVAELGHRAVGELCDEFGTR